MKIYFSATITEDKELKDMYKKIIAVLKKQGHQVHEYGSYQLDPKQLVHQSDEEIQEKSKRLDKFLKNADIYIADISLPSIGIGYEISQAISLKKPVLALNFKKAKYQPLATIKGKKSKFLRYESYTEENIEEILKSFMAEAKRKIDTKFILIISPEIERYLEWTSEQKRMHKAQIVRNAIEETMNRDKEYKKHQSKQGF